MKTATLERYAIFGTSRHMQRLTYRGRELVGTETPCAGQETAAHLRHVAAQRGFSRIRFAGDWGRLTVRKTMCTRSGTERVAER